jgi:hypothetical protein
MRRPSSTVAAPGAAFVAEPGVCSPLVRSLSTQAARSSAAIPAATLNLDMVRFRAVDGGGMKPQQSCPVHRPEGRGAGCAWLPGEATMRSTAVRAAGKSGRPRKITMTGIVFGISLFLGVAAVTLVAFTLLWIALGKVDA